MMEGAEASSEKTLQQQLKDLPADARRSLEAHGFDPAWLLRMATRLTGESQHSNVVSGKLEAPAPDDVISLPPDGSAEYQRLHELGAQALRAGEVALVVLAGGMATRMGGVVKALVEALPGRTFLDLRLAEVDALTETHGSRPPLWLMTSPATDAGIREALGSRLDGKAIGVFCQYLSARLTPEGKLFRDAQGAPSLHSPGHGDLPDALRESGLLQDFIAQGGRVVMTTNLDNLGGGLDPAVIGFHLDGRTQVTCEVVDKVGSDRGGIPVRLDGKPVVLEEFRLPDDFDPTRVPVFNVNTFIFDAKALADLDFDWTYFTVEKKVDGTPVVQFERLINEVTFALPTRYLRVPREGAASRFLPVKDFDELAARRDEITQVARSRGMISAQK